jgi:hypothetical protein
VGARVEDCKRRRCGITPLRKLDPPEEERRPLSTAPPRSSKEPGRE